MASCSGSPDWGADYSLPVHAVFFFGAHIDKVQLFIAQYGRSWGKVYAIKG